MELHVYQVDGHETGRTVTLDAGVFGIEPNDHVLWLDIRRIQANGRQGTHKAKERGEVAGSTRKLYRQKGTGMARAGSSKSPLRRSGGRTFGPRPRSYGMKLNKKTRQLARRSALSYKARADALRVVEHVTFETPDTRELAAFVEALNLAGQKVLVLTLANNETLYRSSTNLAKVHVQEVRNTSSFEVLNADVIVLEEGALDVLSQTLGGGEAASWPETEAVVEAEPEVEAVAEVEAAEAEAEVVVEVEVTEAEAEVVAEVEVTEAEAEVVAEAEATEAEAAPEDAGTTDVEDETDKDDD